MILPALAITSMLQCTGSCAPLTNADLRLVATVTPQRILVGEFVTVRTTWTALREIPAPATDGGWVEVDRGQGFVAHVEAFEGWLCVVEAPRDWRRGRRLVTEHSIGLEQRTAALELSGLDAVNASAALVFERPGRYRVRFRYDEAVSNAIEIEAVAPAGDDARLLETLRRRPIVLSWYARVEEPVRAEGQALVATFGRHRYLQPFLRQVEGTLP
jgi:hypothetical protein